MNYQQISTTATSEEPEYRSTVGTLPRQTGKLLGVDGYSMRSRSSSDRAHGLRLGERRKAESINLIFSTRLLSFYSVRRCRRVSVRPTDRPSQAGIIVSKFERTGRIDLVVSVEASSHLPLRTFKIRVGPYFPLEFCPELWTEKISLRQVDCVVNKTHRRSSLLTTLTTVDASRLDARGLLHVRRPYCSNFVTSICCGFVKYYLFLRLFSSRQDSN